MAKETNKLLEVGEDVKHFYKEAFDDFDWNKNGRITCRVQEKSAVKIFLNIYKIFLKRSFSLP